MRTWRLLSTVLASTATMLLAVTPVMAEKVVICHVPPGNPENAHTISISTNALKAHLGENEVGLHGGDHLGACSLTPTSTATASPTALPVPTPTGTPIGSVIVEASPTPTTTATLSAPETSPLVTSQTSSVVATPQLTPPPTDTVSKSPTPTMDWTVLLVLAIATTIGALSTRIKRWQ